MIFTTILLLGTISLFTLPIELMPDIQLGTVSVITRVRGGLPSEEVEKRISKPLEEALGDTSHMKNMLSISKEGESTIVLEFEPDTNMNYASLEVREKLARVKKKLPRESERPMIIQYGYGDFPIIAVSFISTQLSPEELRKFVEGSLKERFLRVEGVARVETVGGREEKIIIELNEKKLTALGISLSEVLDKIGSSNVNLLAGEMEYRGQDYLIRTLGEFSSIEEIENLGIQMGADRSVVRLKDIGKVEYSYLEPKELGRLNRNPAVTLYIFKKSLANTLKVCNDIEQVTSQVKTELGDTLTIILPFNHGEFIKKAIQELRLSLLIGIIAAVGVLIFFLKDYLAILILSVSIPFSILITFTFMKFLKISLNVMTLAGLCLGIGMLLDSSIVVLENIFKRQDQGQTVDKKTISSCTKEVGKAIFASTLTTIVVFLPFMFINKETQKLYSGIALVIIFSLIGSIFVSLSFIPLLSHLILAKRNKQKPAVFFKFQQWFRKTVTEVLSIRGTVIIIITILFLISIFIGTKLEKEFIRMPEQSKFTIFVQLPTGTRLDITDNVVGKVEEYLEEYRMMGEVQSYTAHVEPFSAKIYVQLEPREKRKMQMENLIAALRERSSDLDPAFIYYEEPQEVESKEIIIEFLGYDYTVLRNIAQQGAQLFRKIPGLTDTKIRMREGGPQLDVILDKNKLALLRLDTLWTTTELHGKLRGLIPTYFHPPEDYNPDAKTPFTMQQSKEIEMIVRLPEHQKKKLRDIKKVTVVTPRGEEVKLSQIADFVFTQAPSEIWRKNKRRMVQVSANRSDTPLGAVTRQIRQEYDQNLTLPEGYRWKFGEGYYKMVRSQKELALAFMFALILVYLVLASFFENLTQPIVILSSIPLAGIITIPLLYLTREPLGIGVWIGAIMLAGIVVNNAIILIDTVNRLKQQKKLSIQDAVREAASLRLRPILMTTSTTILPLIPLLIIRTDASSLWAPLALTVVSGLVTSCILTLYVIPCIYLFFYRDLVELRRGRISTLDLMKDIFRKPKIKIDEEGQALPDDVGLDDFKLDDLPWDDQ
ncbi:MAG: efflux RND transporter permease subunit [Candidatus Omnitrophica bacterium]|nr:efflux RND transporter permease subunit [Candidatus Omnitrophota bacterium]